MSTQNDKRDWLKSTIGPGPAPGARAGTDPAFGLGAAALIIAAVAIAVGFVAGDITAALF